MQPRNAFSAAVVLTALLAASAGAARRCSMIAMPGVKTEGDPFFLGRALADTVLAGPGSTKPGAGGGHYGQSGSGTAVYGQLVAVQRTGGSKVPRDAARADTVLVVPWDYDAGCVPVQWGGSARWLGPGPQRFFLPRLRAREHWAGSVPTYDAFVPGAQVYPAFATTLSPLQTGLLAGWDSGAAAPAESVFAFYEAMPALPESREVDAKTFRRIRNWAARHPALATTSPVAEVLRELAYQATVTRARTYVVPMLGTYRLTVTLPRGEPRTYYLRTADRPDQYSVHFPSGPDDAPSGGPLDMPTLGIDVTFWIAATEAGLPAEWTDAGRSSWGWHIAWRDSIRPDGEWPADIDPHEFFDLWKDEDADAASFQSAYGDWFDGRWEAGTLPTWLGAFHRGHGTFRQVVPSDSSGTMIVEAVRVGRATVRDRERD